MTDGWFPHDSNDSSSEDEFKGDWPQPEGPSEWGLFRRESEPDVVLSDGAVDAIAKGEPIDSVLITFGDHTLSLQADPLLWAHIFTAVEHEARRCPDCRELKSVFQCIIDRLSEREE